MKIEAYGHTDVGPVREGNEDNLLIDLDHNVFLLADGMGGHAAGEVASEMAVEITHSILIKQVDPDETQLVRDFDPTDPSDILRERLRYAMNQASVRIRRTSDENPEKRGMGTTLVTLILENGRAHLAHVGDSRIYLLRNNRISRLTRDHTIVQQQIDAGYLSEELARLARHKNVLTQSIGFHGPVEPDTTTRMVEAGDLFLLCSDGLSDPLTDADIAALMTEHPLDALPEALVNAAIEAGGTDNVTVVLVHVVSVS